MNPVHLEPKNLLEIALGQAQAGKIPMADLLQMMMATDLFIVSVEEVASRASGLHPLLFDRDGVPMAAVYTDPARTELAGSTVKSVVRMKGATIFRNTPAGYGIVINPGFDVGLELLPEGVRNVVDKYCVK